MRASAATVSRALRGLHHVNERTRKKIVAAAQELDYPIRPDLLPRSESSRTNTIGAKICEAANCPKNLGGCAIVVNPMVSENS